MNILDLRVQRNDNGNLITDWYCKHTASGRYIHFLSHHPIAQKRAIVYGLVDKCMKLSDRSFHKCNLDRITFLLLDNGFPIDFIKEAISRRLKVLNNYNNNLANQSKNKNFSNIQKVFLPYNKNLSPHINSLAKKLNIVPIYNNINKLNNLIRLGKDRLDKNKKCNVIYKINCKDCNATYIGQSKRNLETRINEHKYYVKKNDHRSVIAKHYIETKHTFDFDKTTIIDIEINKKKREFVEMLNIHYHDHTLNMMEDTMYLKKNYKNSISEIKRRLRVSSKKSKMNETS